MIALIVVFYLVGCVLAFGGLNAIFQNIDYKCIEDLPPSKLEKNCFWGSPFSWFILLFTIYDNYKSNGEYYIKFSDKDLWEMYYEYHPDKKPKP
jgi:hypothetical protein